MTFTKTSPKGYKYTNKDITIYINYVWGYRNK